MIDPQPGMNAVSDASLFSNRCSILLDVKKVETTPATAVALAFPTVVSNSVNEAFEVFISPESIKIGSNLNREELAKITDQEIAYAFQALPILARASRNSFGFTIGQVCHAEMVRGEIEQRRFVRESDSPTIPLLS